MNTVKSLLNQLCGSGNRNRTEIETELRNYFTDPLYIGNSDSLRDSDPMKRDARIVSDAFDAVTNGMHDEWVLSSLKEIGEDSFFCDWRYLTESLYHLYGRNRDSAFVSLDMIAEDSIPALLKDVIRIAAQHPFHPDTAGNLNETEKQLLGEIARENLRMRENVEGALSCLGKKDSDSFTDIVTLIVTDIYPASGDNAESIAVWALRQFFSSGMDHTLFLENMKLIFGDTASSRICALALMEEDSELSMLFWIRAAVSEIRKNSPPRAAAEAYLDIIYDLKKSVTRAYEPGGNTESQEEDILVREQSENLLIVLKKEIEISFPGLSGHALFSESTDRSVSVHSPDKAPCGSCGNSRAVAGNRAAAVPAGFTGKTGKTEGERRPVQLELFA